MWQSTKYPTFFWLISYNFAAITFKAKAQRKKTTFYHGRDSTKMLSWSYFHDVDQECFVWKSGDYFEKLYEFFMSQALVCVNWAVYFRRASRVVRWGGFEGLYPSLWLGSWVRSYLWHLIRDLWLEPGCGSSGWVWFAICRGLLGVDVSICCTP